MSFVIPDDILQAARMSEEELQRELALLLFQQEKLSLGKAGQLAKMTKLEFQHLLASRAIPVHYDVADFEQDLQTLKDLGRL